MRLALTDVAGHTWHPSFAQGSGSAVFKRSSTVLFEASTLFPMGELASCRAWLEQVGEGGLTPVWNRCVTGYGERKVTPARLGWRRCVASAVGPRPHPLNSFCPYPPPMQASVGLGDDWHLDRINVTHLPSGRSWAFVLNNWVGKQEAVMQAQVSG